MSWTERLVTKLAKRPAAAEPDGTSRRGFLAGATVAGAALAVEPWGYLTKPADAYSTLCGTDAACSDGYSAFCCTINKGHNTCPPNTFAGGWWKADRSSFCGGAARYYIDCNALPGHHFDCHCANNGSCDHRLVACNVFRYGQCNTQIKGTTAVVCRQISCRPPWQLYPGHCGTSSATDQNTAGHSAPCLTKANTYPRLVTFPAAPSSMAAYTRLRTGERLTSPDRHSTAYLTEKGNLIIQDERGVVWSSHTRPGAAGGYVGLTTHGNLIIHRADHSIAWQSRPAPTGSGYRLELHNNSNLVVTNGHQRWWHTDVAAG